MRALTFKNSGNIKLIADKHRLQESKKIVKRILKKAEKTPICNKLSFQ